ncbi:Mechanosensitive ion channel [Carnobacterium iners]|uniref:Mechanosensitive ion channel n=1 Tax=Carnobacterium iners TaxID=1073423 RepID=A0A1X7MYS4_9LACT|nr:mechanosensitive ion channel domain-containing protein [Carnobacterium iners]SEK17860.1 Mechanosensitive ion channel [Carnobacterium iners]SMH29244.1 Mechanosensitive ion channel [Carnobacterium iners]
MNYIRNFIGSYPLLVNIIWFFIFFVVLYGVRRFLLNRLYRGLKDSGHWYVVRKVARWANNFVLFIVFMSIFGRNLSGFTTAIGLAGAGVTYALREVIVSIAGWFAILFGDFFETGDRVLLGGIKGDVVDIGILRTTLMELGEWVDGDQYTGRIVRVANSYIFSSPVYNYNADFEFLWDEIMIPLRFESDMRLAKTILLELAEEHTGQYNTEATIAWEKMKRRYKLENASLENQVYLSFNDNWVEVSLRYVVDYRERRGVKDQLFSEILRRFEQEGERIEVASETIEITSGRSTKVK